MSSLDISRFGFRVYLSGLSHEAHAIGDKVVAEVDGEGRSSSGHRGGDHLGYLR